MFIRQLSWNVLFAGDVPQSWTAARQARAVTTFAEAA